MRAEIKYMIPEIAGVIIGALVLNLWFLSSIAIEHRVIPTTYDYFLKAVVVLSAAFFGSFSAFYLNTRKEKQKEVKGNIAALNAALFVTLRQLNAILVIKQKITPLAQDPLRFLTLSATYSSDYSDLKIAFDRLEFLIKDHPNLLFELSTEQAKFESAVTATNMRAEFHHKELQKALSDSKFEIERPTIDELIDAVGPRVVGTSIQLTNGMFEQILLTSDSLKALHEKLFDISREIFPNEKFVKFVENE